MSNRALILFLFTLAWAVLLLALWAMMMLGDCGDAACETRRSARRLILVACLAAAHPALFFFLWKRLPRR